MTDAGSTLAGSTLAERLRLLSEEDGADPVSLTREEAKRLVDVAEKAQALLVNAYAIPADEHGVRLKSEDAVRLQWALRQIGVGERDGDGSDSQGPSFPFSV